MVSEHKYSHLPNLQRLNLPEPSEIWSEYLDFNNFSYVNDDIAHSVESGQGWSAFLHKVINTCYSECSPEQREHAIALTKNIDAIHISGYWLPGGNEQSIVANMAFLLSLYYVDDIIEAYRLAEPSILEAMTKVWRDMPHVIETHWELMGSQGKPEQLAYSALQAYGRHEIPEIYANYKICAFASASARYLCANDKVYEQYANTSAHFIQHHIEVSLTPTQIDSLTVAEVIQRRVIDSAVTPTVWNLIAVSRADGVEQISEALIDSPEFQSAFYHLCSHIGIINDIFSYQREYQEGSNAQINFVNYAYRQILLKADNPDDDLFLLLVEAVNQTINELNKSMYQLKEATLVIGRKHHVGGEFMARVMIRCLLGSVKWSLGCPRYTMKEYVLAAMGINQ